MSGYHSSADVSEKDNELFKSVSGSLMKSPSGLRPAKAYHSDLNEIARDKGKNPRTWRRRFVARIEFLEWTPDNRLRHPRFAGTRSDKDARPMWCENAVIS